MNKKLIVLLVILIAAAVGVYLLSAQPADQLPQEEQQPTGQKPGGSQTGGTPLSGGSVQVDIKGFTFVGATTRIDAGTTIIWKNMDSVAHTVTSDTGVFNSGALLKGQSFYYTFTQPGTYKYHCALHPTSMTGDIVVK